MFKRWQRMEAALARALCRAAALHPLADQAVDLPAWYCARWHFLPEGYLSERSARAYDMLIRRVYTAGQQKSADDLVARVMVRRRATAVLEVGCGSGRLLERLARALPGAGLAGVDLSPYLLDLAARRLRGRANLRQADAARLPFDDGRFDAVVACHVLGHVPPDVAAEASREARRVLRPRGTLVVVDHTWHHPGIGRWRLLGSRLLAAGTVRVQVFEAPGASHC